MIGLGFGSFVNGFTRAYQQPGLGAADAQVQPQQVSLPAPAPQVESSPTAFQIKDIKTGWDGGKMSGVKGMVIHHTGGRGDVNGVIDTLNKRRLSVQFVVDRDGSVYRLTPEGEKASHMLNGWGDKGTGLGNANMQGVEVIARDDKDVLPVQVNAVKQLVEGQAKLYGFDPRTSVFGHGEVNPGHKEADEGMSSLKVIRAATETTTADKSNGGIQDYLGSLTHEYGLPQGYLTGTAKLESSFNPNDVSPTGAAGLFQFTKDTAKRMGLGNRFDPYASADAAARLAKENKAALEKSLGREPTAAELYLAHQQGASGASALLSHPDMNAVDALAPAYGGDRAAAERAIKVNGGNTNMTAGQFAGNWTSKFDGAATAASNRISDNDYRAAFPNAPHFDSGNVAVAQNNAPGLGGSAPRPQVASNTNTAAPGLFGGGPRRGFFNPFGGIQAPQVTVIPLTSGPVARAPQIVDPSGVVIPDPLPIG